MMPRRPSFPSSVVGLILAAGIAGCASGGTAESAAEHDGADPDRSASADAGLVQLVHYSMSHVEGNVLVDSSTSGNDATIRGATQQSEGSRVFLRFGGGSASVGGPVLDIPTFSASASFRINGTSSRGAQNDVSQYIVGNDRNMSPPAGGFAMFVRTGNHVLCGEIWFVDAQQSVTLQKICGTEPVEFSTWHRASLTYDGIDLELTLDGQPVAFRHLPGGRVGASALPLTLGALAYHAAEATPSNPAYFALVGDVDDVVVSDAPPASRDFAEIAGEAALALDFAADGEYFDAGQLASQVTAHGTVSSGPGVEGLAMRLGDTPGYLEVSPHAWNPHAVTTAAWVKLDAQSDHQYVFSCDRDVPMPAGGFSLRVSRPQPGTTVGKVKAAVGLVGGQRVVTSSSTIPTGTWVHLASVFDGTSLSVYIDGKLDARTSFPPDALLAAPLPLRLGALAYQAPTWYRLRGSIDDALVFERALGQAEIADLAQARAGGTRGSRFEFEPEFGRARDRGSNFRHLSLQNGAAFTTDGFLGGGIEFSAPSYARAVGSRDDAAAFANAFTAAAWFRSNSPGSAHQYVFSNDRDLSNPAGGFSLRIDNASRKLRAFLDAGNTKLTLLSTSTIAADQWHHAAVVFDGTRARLYVDGIEQASAAIAAPLPAWPFDLRLGSLGFGDNGQWYGFEGTIDEFVLLPKALTASEITGLAGKLRIRTAPAIRNTWVLPDAQPWSLVDASRGMRVGAARGEYEPVSLVVESPRAAALANVRVVAGALAGPNASSIPASAIDVKLVRAWYQGAGDVTQYSDARELKPELLINDPALVAVDDVAMQNTVRNIAWPADANSLLPVTIPAGRAQQFWLTVHVPANASAGTYVGQVTISSDGNADVRVPLTVDVAAFDLDPPSVHYGIYYTSERAPQGTSVTNVNTKYRTAQQYSAEMADLLAHGVTAPSMYTSFANGSGNANIDAEMTARAQAGLPLAEERILYLGLRDQHSKCVTGAISPTAYQQIVADVLGRFADNDYPEPLFYGTDEASGMALGAQIACYRAIQAAGGRTAVAAYYNYQDDLEAAEPGAASVLDVVVLAVDHAIRHGGLTSAVGAAHALGKEVWAYDHPQAGIERPFTYRKNFGLSMWAAGFDGVSDWAYQASHGVHWDDFASTKKNYRNENFTYPTATGVVDTIQWEGFREGVDDVRYVTTLERLADLAAASNDAGTRAQGDATHAYLDRLRSLVLAGKLGEDAYDDLRRELAGRIAALDAVI